VGTAAAAAGNADIASYAHFEVDRFAILLDTWSNEMSFLQCKKEVHSACCLNEIRLPLLRVALVLYKVVASLKLIKVVSASISRYSHHANSKTGLS